MKQTIFYALLIAGFAACNGNSGSGNGSSSDTTSTSSNAMGKADSSAVPDSVTGGSGYLPSGNNANGNENAGNLNNDTIPMGAGRSKTPDSIKAKVNDVKKADTTMKHHK